MRLIMLGTGPFAVPTLQRLYESRHSVSLVVTGAVHPHRGKGRAPATPMRDLAHEHGTPIFDPEEINSESARHRLSGCKADLLVVCDYGQILSSATLATAQLGGINLHASLLPKYRGAAPINWAIYHGETETGVTVIHMTPRIDAGPCIAQARTPIEPDETAAELETRLAEMGAWLIRRTIDLLGAGELEALPQDPALASKAPRLKKTDGLVDWSRPAAAIKNHIRALEPWPKSYTFWHRPEGPPIRLILGPVAVIDPELAPGALILDDSSWGKGATALDESPGAGSKSGMVLEARDKTLIVAAGRGAVALQSVQPAGKRMLGIEEFLRGYHVQPGDRFGPE
jgi:methionyl-tRNA formyltransferase